MGTSGKSSPASITSAWPRLSDLTRVAYQVALVRRTAIKRYDALGGRTTRNCNRVSPPPVMPYSPAAEARYDRTA